MSFEKPSESEKIIETLPKEVDRVGGIFAYGFLLDPDNIKRLLAASRTRKPEDITVIEASSLAELGEIAKNQPDAVGMLRKVALTNVHGHIVTEELLHRAIVKKFGLSSIEEYAQYVQKQFGQTFHVPARENQYLYVRPCSENENPRSINGGLVLFKEGDLGTIDADEYVEKDTGVYARRIVPELIIEGTRFKPEYIGFYAGNVGDIHDFVNPDAPNESRKQVYSEVLGNKSIERGRKRGHLPDSAKWPHSKEHTVRGRLFSDEDLRYVRLQ